MMRRTGCSRLRLGSPSYMPESWYQSAPRTKKYKKIHLIWFPNHASVKTSKVVHVSGLRLPALSPLAGRLLLLRSNLLLFRTVIIAAVVVFLLGRGRRAAGGLLGIPLRSLALHLGLVVGVVVRRVAVAARVVVRVVIGRLVRAAVDVGRPLLTTARGTLLRAVVELHPLVDRLLLNSSSSSSLWRRLLRVNGHGIAVLALRELLQYRLGAHALDHTLRDGDVARLRHEAALVEALPLATTTAILGAELLQPGQDLLVLGLLRVRVRRAVGEGGFALGGVLLPDLVRRLAQPRPRVALEVLDVLVEGVDVGRGDGLGVEDALHEDGLVVLVELPGRAGVLPGAEVLEGGLDVGLRLLRRGLGRLLALVLLLCRLGGGGGVLRVFGESDGLLLPQGRGSGSSMVMVVGAGPFEGGAERRGNGRVLGTFPFGGGAGGVRRAVGVPGVVVLLVTVGLRSLGSRAANLWAGLELEAQSFPGRYLCGHDGQQRAHPLRFFFLRPGRRGREGRGSLDRNLVSAVAPAGSEEGTENAELGRFNALHVCLAY
ncbi:hypothetical protein CCHR01_04838 [Colletotrichum chrysophilum]|uniref:Uncharacterized protein n=1 Tax=Colletotrichum chrysophilum TaxID=1836956 RepID=A0AAD9AS43_9PEZI|nr:hypothetical protein CCHR01_04838 [Colletotrichum chrysophilum]